MAHIYIHSPLFLVKSQLCCIYFVCSYINVWPVLFHKKVLNFLIIYGIQALLTSITTRPFHQIYKYQSTYWFSHSGLLCLLYCLYIVANGTILLSASDHFTCRSRFIHHYVSVLLQHQKPQLISGTKFSFGTHLLNLNFLEV